MLLWPDYQEAGNPFVRRFASEVRKLGLCVEILTEQRVCGLKKGDLIVINWFENYWIELRYHPDRAQFDHRRILWEKMTDARQRGVQIIYFMHNVAPHAWGDSSFLWFQYAYDFYSKIDYAVHLTGVSHEILKRFYPKIKPILAFHPSYEVGFLNPYSNESFVGLSDGVLLLGDIVKRKKIRETFDLAVKSRANKVCVVGRPKDKVIVDDIKKYIKNYCFHEKSLVIDIVNTCDAALRSYCGSHSMVILNQRQALNSGVMFFALSNGSPVLAPNSPQNIEIQSTIGDGWVRLYDGDLTSASINMGLSVPVPKSKPKLKTFNQLARTLYDSVIACETVF